MDILMGFGRYEGGGFTTVVTSLARALQLRGHNVTVGVRTILVDTPEDVDVRVMTPKEFKEVSRGFDIVHIHTSFPYTYEVAKDDIKFVFTHHGYCPWYLVPGLKGKLVHLALKYAYLPLLRKASVLTAISHYVRRQIRSIYGLEAVVVPNGVNLGLFRRISVEKPEGFPILFNATTWSKQKGPDILIKDFRVLRREYPEARLIVKMPNNPDSWTSRLYDRTIGQEEGVLMVPFDRKELPVRYYSMADIYLLTSRWESFALPILESFAVGTPVLARDADDARREHIHASGGGLLYTGGDIISRLREILHKWRTFSRKGMEYSKKFDWNNIASKYEKLYEEVT